MLKLDKIEFPSKYLTCYESVLMTLLKHQGVTETAPLMGTQAYFVFKTADFSISPKFSSIDEEWQRLYSFQVETLPATNETDLYHKLRSRLDANVPVCLPVDLYTLPHTLHHKQLHQHHYITIFGHDNGRYYMVCPYYRFQGWVEANLIHSGFFSNVVSTRGNHLITIPQLAFSPLSPQNITTLIEKNCHYMLNLVIPPTLTNVASPFLGLKGIHTFSHHFQQLSIDNPEHKPIYINLSRHSTAVGHSRYWFHKLIQNTQPNLLTANLQNQFTDIVQAWKTIGIRLGMGIHGQRAQMIQQVSHRLRQIHQQETRLFNTLLGALPNYQQGTL